MGQREFQQAFIRHTEVDAVTGSVLEKAVSPDGEWILLSRQDASGTDLMLVENFR